MRLSRRGSQVHDQPISYFLEQAVQNPGLISLAAGMVDPLTVPGHAIRHALDELLADPTAASAAFQYGTTQGLLGLRDRLLRDQVALDGVTADELSLSARDVVITTGSQQLLYLLMEVLCDPGDLVLTETPTYYGYLIILKALGLRSVGVPMDNEGLNLDALEERLRMMQRSGEIERLRLIYVCDYFQNPSGLSLSPSRRQRLVELAKRYSTSRPLYIIEDAAYRELRYDGPDVPSLKRYDEDNTHVILALSFSKTLSPGLKTGYGILPRELVTPVVGVKSGQDFGSNNLSQHLIDRLLHSGAYEKHVAAMCPVYREKRDLLMQALERAFARWPQVRWTRPDGGLYVWLTFPEGVDAGSALVEAAVRCGVLYVPGAFCSPDAGQLQRHARLCFAPVPSDQLGEAMRRLASALEQVL